MNEVAPNAITAGQQQERSENDVARVEQSVFLELLIAARRQAVSFRWINHASTGNALPLVGKSRDPYHSGERHEAQ